MEGYFSYDLYGRKEELENAINKIEKLSKKDSKYKELFRWKQGDIHKIDDENKYSVNFSCCGKMLLTPDSFENIMEDLCVKFKELEIEGTGYLCDFPPYSIWKSKAGESSFEESYENRSLALSYEDYVDENECIIEDTIEIECEGCGNIIKKPTTDLLGEPEYDNEAICEECGLVYELELY